MEVKKSIIHERIFEKIKDNSWEGKIEVEKTRLILANFRIYKSDFNKVLAELCNNKQIKFNKGTAYISVLT